MIAVLAIVHILIGFALIVFVLLQDPKGGAMGVFSGGSSSNSFFGASGASNFLTSTTKWLAILFAASCLALTYITTKRGATSVMDSYANPPAPTAPAPGAVPGTAAPEDGTAAPAAPATAPEKPADQK
jgi:preprotein translocase subunit SecG